MSSDAIIPPPMCGFISSCFMLRRFGIHFDYGFSLQIRLQSEPNGFDAQRLEPS